MYLLIVFAPPLEHHWPGVKIEKPLFSSVILKTQFVASEEGTAQSHVLPSERIIGGLN